MVEEQRPNYNNSLWLNVGDEFQGTLFYSFYGGEKIAETLNQMNFSAMTLGNHEVSGSTIGISWTSCANVCSV